MKSMIGIVILLWASIASGVMALEESAAELWRSIRDQVAMNGTLDTNGWTFVSRAVPMADDAADNHMLESDLEFDIFEHVRVLASPAVDIEFDHEVDSEGRSSRISLFLPPVTIRGLVQVESAHDEGMIRVVYAVPSAELAADPVSAAHLSKMVTRQLERPISADRGHWSSPLVFVSDLSFDPGLQQQAADRLIASYPAGLGALLRAEVPEDVGRGWCLVPESLGDSSAALDDWMLLDVLEERSQDYELAVELQSRLKALGLNELAARLQMPQPVEWGGSGAAEIYTAFDMAQPATGMKLEAICRSNGTVPFRTVQDNDDDFKQARAAFFADPPDFKQAGSLLIGSIQNRPTVENLNLLGACLIESGQPGLAVPVARMAWRAEPSHAYAGVNYVRALADSGSDAQQIEQVMDSVRAKAKLDDWGNGQLVSVAKILEQARESAARPEVEPSSP